MKKVVFYIDSMVPSGGIERVVSTLLFKLCDKVESVLLTKDTGDSFYPIPSKVQRLNLGLKGGEYNKSKIIRVKNIVIYLLKEVVILRKLLKSINYDFFYCTHPISVLTYRLAGGDLSKLIISEHGSHLGYNAVYRTMKKVLYKRCNSYVVPTLSDSDYYNSIGISATYIEHFRPNLEYSMDDSSCKQVLNIGRLTDDKQQGILIDIWDNILQKNPSLDNWKLVIVGSGENEIYLKNKIKTSRFSSTISIHNATPDIVKHYKSSSIFTLASRFEGFGMVLIEAISFGLPVISFDCPSGPRDIINKKNGFLVPCFDNEQYSKYLLNLMRDDVYRENLSKQAFHEGVRWESDLITNKWLEVLK